jgi:hypothetical protein
MDEMLQTNFDNLCSKNRPLQTTAFNAVIAATDQPVAWAYEVWDSLVANMGHGDNHQRSIAMLVLANLAKSDPDKRILRDFESLLTLTRETTGVTPRHCIQGLWKIGLAGSEQRQVLLDGLERRFQECSTEKIGSLLRYDIIQSLRHLYDVVKDESIREKALALIETEADVKQRKKYAALWKK